jgi:hypothetical protein
MSTHGNFFEGGGGAGFCMSVLFLQYLYEPLHRPKCVHVLSLAVLSRWVIQTGDTDARVALNHIGFSFYRLTGR